MTNNDLFQFLEGLKGVANLKGVKFAYAVAKNMRKVLAICQDLEKSQEPSAEFKAFEKLRIKLCGEYARRDKNGEPIMKPATEEHGSQFALRDRVAFEVALEKLKTEHPGLIEGREKGLEEYIVLLNEEADFEPYTIPFDLLPEDITTGQLEAIFEMIQEPKDA